jgi:hypothetical protein
MGRAEVKGMHRLRDWYAAKTRSQTWAFVETRPGPTLLWDGSEYSDYLLLITARNGQFVLILDDKSPGSIPNEQTLGPTESDPETVTSRAIDTVWWFARKQRAEGNGRRATYYRKTVRHVINMLGRPAMDTPDEVAADGKSFEELIEDAKGFRSSVGHRLDVYGDAFAGVGDWQNALQAYAHAGRCHEHEVDEAGHPDDMRSAVASFSKAINVIPPDETVDWSDELRARHNRAVQRLQRYLA